MITYKIEFEEKPDGTMRIHYESPPTADATQKEQLIATGFINHVKQLLLSLSKNARFQIDN